VTLPSWQLFVHIVFIIGSNGSSGGSRKSYCTQFTPHHVSFIPLSFLLVIAIPPYRTTVTADEIS